MAEPDLRVRTYLRAFLGDAMTLMSGGLSVPFVAVALWVSSRGQKILWGCLAFVSFVFASYRVWRQERLDASTRFAELKSSLEEAIARKDIEIAKHGREIQNLTDKPKRTAAEQHHYETAKAALQNLGRDAVIALRHLRTNGKLTFGFYPPPSLPVGMSPDQLHNIYRACAGKGLVTQHEKTGSGERTFEIAPTMNHVLDELLYEGRTGET